MTQTLFQLSISNCDASFFKLIVPVLDVWTGQQRMVRRTLTGQVSSGHPLLAVMMSNTKCSHCWQFFKTRCLEEQVLIICSSPAPRAWSKVWEEVGLIWSSATGCSLPLIPPQDHFLASALLARLRDGSSLPTGLGHGAKKGERTWEGTELWQAASILCSSTSLAPLGHLCWETSYLQLQSVPKIQKLNKTQC